MESDKRKIISPQAGHTICVILNLEAIFMNKLFAVVLSFVLICSLTACGCQAQEPVQPTTMPTTVPSTTAPATTAPTTMPTETTVPMMDPTIETNIPDPEVESNSTDSITETTGETTATEGMGARSRMRMR